MSTPQEFKDAIAKIQKLNPSAVVFARVHHLIATPDVQLEDIANVIKLDTALTADIIRLSNSSALGGSVPTGSLPEAIGRVGLKEVYRFLGLSISKRVMNRNLQCYGISAYDFWSSSVATAILMGLLAKRLGEDEGEAHTIGILHSAGRLVINQVLDEMRLSSFWDWKTPIEMWELASVGFTYSTAGALLLHGWGFPESFCEIIEYQLAPGKAPQKPPMLKMLNFCLRLLLSTGVDLTNPDWKLSVEDPFLREFYLSMKEMKDFVKTAQQKHMEAEASLVITR